MKTISFSIIMLATVALAGCATGTNTNTNTNTNNSTNNPIGAANTIGMNILKTAIDNQCRSQIEQQTAWQIASVAMTDNQEEAVKDKVCNCVSEQAPQHVTFTELGNAAIDAEYRTRLVTRVVAKSLQSCYSNFVAA